MKYIGLTLILVLLIATSAFADGYYGWQDTAHASVLATANVSLENSILSPTSSAGDNGMLVVTEDGCIDTIYALIYQNGDPIEVKAAVYVKTDSDTSIIDSAAAIDLNIDDTAWVAFPVNAFVSSGDSLLLPVWGENNTATLWLFKGIVSGATGASQNITYAAWPEPPAFSSSTFTRLFVYCHYVSGACASAAAGQVIIIGGN